MSIEQQCVIIEIGFAGEGLILCYLSMCKYKCLNKNWFDSAYAGHYAAFFFVKKVCRLMEYKVSKKKNDEFKDEYNSSLKQKDSANYGSNNNTKGSVVNYFYNTNLNSTTLICNKTNINVHDLNSDDFSSSTSSCTVNDVVDISSLQNILTNHILSQTRMHTME